MWCYRRILKISWTKHTSNEGVPGQLNKDRELLSTIKAKKFALCLLVIFIIELAVGIAAAVYKNDFHKGIKQLMRESMNKYETNEADRMAWDNLQTKLKCCGVDKNNDWILLLGKRPLSCCHATRDGSQPPEAIHCNSAKTGDEILYSDGCFDMIEYKAEEASKVLIGVGIGIAFVELIGIVLACWLASAIKSRS
ncbi:tetraspanin-7-like [Sitophilus oryzae]|uniref:Tetraspanin-7-like n=1 Tax=Sitophilus oryzae TaxID=7048 RepID=A0A6J2Y7H0_SITOR|nr:tetraspanin-7-like [Sitophilus oryzae]